MSNRHGLTHHELEPRENREHAAMNRRNFTHARRPIRRIRFSPIWVALMTSATFLACSDDSDHNVPGASGTSRGGSAGASGRGGASTASAGCAGSAQAPEGGSAGDTIAGGSAGEIGGGGEAGDMNSGGSAGDSGVAGQSGDAGDCAQGYARFGAGCVAACAPHDLDGANIALSIGHTDVVAAAYDAASSELSMFTSDDSFPIRQQVSVRRKPETVLVHGTVGAIIQVPDIPALTGIFQPETDIWLFPEGQPEAEAAGILWPGLQSYGVGQGVLQGNRATLRLASTEGAGKFVGFATVQDEATPPELLFDPVHGLNEFPLPTGTHLHLNWAFTQGGLHRLTFELEATTLDDEVVKSAQHTYRFFFGSLAELPATEPTIVVVEGLASSYQPGDELALTAVRHGAASALPAAWSRQCYDPVTFEPQPWEPIANGEALATTVASGCQYLACLMDETTPVAISQAVMPRLH
jgi:surface-anchored protein